MEGQPEDQPTNHPYVQYVSALNWTACYKELLLAGNSKIENYIPSNERTKYFEMRKDFFDKYPEIASEFRNLKPSDCVIL